MDYDCTIFSNFIYPYYIIVQGKIICAHSGTSST